MGIFLLVVTLCVLIAFIAPFLGLWTGEQLRNIAEKSISKATPITLEQALARMDKELIRYHDEATQYDTFTTLQRQNRSRPSGIKERLEAIIKAQPITIHGEIWDIKSNGANFDVSVWRPYSSQPSSELLPSYVTFLYSANERRLLTSLSKGTKVSATGVLRSWSIESSTISTRVLRRTGDDFKWETENTENLHKYMYMVGVALLKA